MPAGPEARSMASRAMAYRSACHASGDSARDRAVALPCRPCAVRGAAVGALPSPGVAVRGAAVAGAAVRPVLLLVVSR